MCTCTKDNTSVGLNCPETPHLPHPPASYHNHGEQGEQIPSDPLYRWKNKVPGGHPSSYSAPGNLGPHFCSHNYHRPRGRWFQEYLPPRQQHLPIPHSSGQQSLDVTCQPKARPWMPYSTSRKLFHALGQKSKEAQMSK